MCKLYGHNCHLLRCYRCSVLPFYNIRMGITVLWTFHIQCVIPLQLMHSHFTCLSHISYYSRSRFRFIYWLLILVINTSLAGCDLTASSWLCFTYWLPTILPKRATLAICLCYCVLCESNYYYCSFLQPACVLYLKFYHCSTLYQSSYPQS